jgi:hypothetical protein
MPTGRELDKYERMLFGILAGEFDPPTLTAPELGSLGLPKTALIPRVMPKIDKPAAGLVVRHAFRKSASATDIPGADG